jgi:hypothetical protein
MANDASGMESKNGSAEHHDRRGGLLGSFLVESVFGWKLQTTAVQQ